MGDLLTVVGWSPASFKGVRYQLCQKRPTGLVCLPGPMPKQDLGYVLKGGVQTLRNVEGHESFRCCWRAENQAAGRTAVTSIRQRSARLKWHRFRGAQPSDPRPGISLPGIVMIDVTTESARNLAARPISSRTPSGTDSASVTASGAARPRARPQLRHRSPPASKPWEARVACGNVFCHRCGEEIDPRDRWDLDQSMAVARWTTTGSHIPAATGRRTGVVKTCRWT